MSEGAHDGSAEPPILSAERFADLLEHAPAAIAVTRGPAHVLTVVNALARRLLGDRPLVGRGYREALPELAGSGLYEDLDAVLATGRPTAAAERSVIFDRDGDGRPEEAFFDVILVPLRDDRGRVSGVLHHATEVTARVRLAAELAGLAEQRYRTMVEQAPDALLILDVDAGRFVTANPAARRLLRMDDDELRAVGPLDLSPTRQPDGRRSADLAALWTHAERDDPPAVEWEFRASDGEPLPCEVHLVRMPDPERRLIRANLRDLRAERRAEDARRAIEAERDALLARLEAQIDLALDAAQLGSYGWDAATGRLRWSEQLEAMAGLAPGTFGGSFDDFIDLVHPEDRGRLRATAQESLRHGDRPTEYRIIRPSGEVRWLWGFGRSVRDAAGATTGLTGVVLDITDRRRAEEELRESARHFRIAADTSPVLIWMADRHSRLTFVNQGWREFTGRRKADGLGLGWRDLIHDADRDTCVATIVAAAAAGRPFEVEFRMAHRAGGHRWVVARGRPMPADEGAPPGYIGVCVDVDDLRREGERQRIAAQVAQALESTMGVEARLERLTRSLVDAEIADIATISMVAPAGGGLRRQTVAARDPAHERALRGLSDLDADAVEASPLMQRIIAENHSILIAQLDEPTLAANAVDPDLHALVAAIGIASLIAVPLCARGTTVALLGLARTDARAPFDEADLDLVEGIARRAAMLIDNARLFELSQAAEAHQEALHAATARLSAAATPEEVVAVAVAEFRRLIADSATVFEMDEEGEHLELVRREGWGVAAGPAWQRVPLAARTPVTDACRSGVGIWLNDADWTRSYPDLVDGFRAYRLTEAAGLPMSVGPRRVGALGLGMSRTTGADERVLAAALAQRCGEALARARVQRDKERERADAQLLADVSRALDAEIGTVRRLRRLVTSLVPRMGEVCAVELVTAGRLELAEASGRAATLRWYERARAEGRLANLGFEEVVTSGEARAVAELPGPHGAGSALVAPIGVRGSVVGALVVVAPADRRRFAAADVVLAQELGRRAGLALDNARLYETERRERERVQALQRVTLELANSANSDAVVRVALAHALRASGADAGAIRTISADGAALELTHSAGLAEPLVRQWARTPLDERSPATEVLRTGETLFLAGAASLAAALPGQPAALAGLGALAVMPLRSGGQPIGVLGLRFAAPISLDPADLDVLTTLATLAAQALERTRASEAVEVARGRAERARERAERLQRVTASLTGATELSAVARIIVEEGMRALDAIAGVLVVAHEADIEVAHAIGYPPHILQSGGRMPLSTAMPLTDAIVRATPVWLETADDWMRHYSPPASALGAAAIVVPLIADARVTGALAFRFGVDERAFSRGERRFALTMAEQCAQALERARLHAAEARTRQRVERANRRLEALQGLTAELSSAVTLQEVRGRTAERVLAAVGADVTWVAPRPGGDEPPALALAGDPALADALRDAPQVALAPAGDAARGTVWMASRREFEAAYPALSRTWPSIRALLVTDIRSEKGMNGAIGAGFCDDHPPRPQDQALLEAVARISGEALERAGRFEEERQTAAALQSALLPDRLPDTAGATLAVRYLPAAGLHAGGDFFDAVVLDDGELSLIVGDVVGHGIRAAAVMGQLRSAWRALALEGSGPAAILAAMDRLAQSTPGAEVTTAVAASLSADGRLRYSCAGHPPPIVRRRSGATRFLDDGRGPPLAVGVAGRREAAARLDAGDLLVAYSDGVVERRGESIDRGLAQLSDAVRRDGMMAPADLVDRLMADLCVDPEDDCVMLACRRAPARPFTIDLTRDPHELARARAGLRAWLAESGFPDEQAREVLLAMSEAAANSIEHGYDAGDAGRITVEVVRQPDGDLAIDVRDDGRWRQAPADAGGRGRGLPIIRDLMGEVLIVPSDAGTTVSMRYGRRRVPEPAGAVTPGPAADASAEPLLITHVHRIVIARLRNEIDAQEASWLRPRVQAAFTDPTSIGAALDLTEITHLGSAGVGMILELARGLPTGRGRLAIIAAPGTLPRRTLELAGTTDVADLADSMDAFLDGREPISR